MENHPTPFPGKTRPTKSKITRKTTEALKKNKSEEYPVLKQKRVFGTIRNTNIPAKTITEKPIIKPSIGVPRKQPNSTQITPNTTEKAVIYATEVAEKKSPAKNRVKSKKKSVCFQEKVVENPRKLPSEGGIIGPRTPVPSPSFTKPKIVGTPYHSAENCSKCRFDRLETSSYWIGQIKLAESVGKHFVSANFFRLALECKSEPNRNLRIELKKYLARHGYLSAQNEWRDVFLSYGLVKDESNAGSMDLGIRKGGTGEITESEGEGHQDQNELKKQAVELMESKK